MALQDVLNDLRRDPGFMANVTAWQTLPARAPRFEATPTALHPELTAALHRRGIEMLYSHQEQALVAALAARNVAVVTPTASGKTLCYNLPVLHRLLADPDATALYLFPTKALAHDQLHELQAWQRDLEESGVGLPPSAVATYDGDTPSGQRSTVRRNVRLLITNPDMLHMGILPYHGGWARFFAGLGAVVIDEMHTYRGVFGSHVANVLRRLQRVAAFYGSRPHFVLTSATIANPQQLAERLIEQPVTVIDENGAPQGEKHILLYNPPLYDPARGLRRSSVLESQELAARALLGGVQTIVFGRSRLTVEVLLGYLRERLARSPAAPIRDARAAIRGYRGGYLPEERRAIEAGLRSGEVRGVVATNALELGIDIGRLEAAVLCGYPGSIASAWQQMGRAGRTADASLAVLVATSGALDQFVINHPEFLLDRSPEHALIQPDNLMLLVDQVRCAAFELPFVDGETLGRSPYTEDVLALLAEQGDVQRYGARVLWQGKSYPARRVSLRSADSDPVVIQAVGARGLARIIGEIDGASAPLLVHEGAIYMHEGQQYVVENLNLAERVAVVVPTEVDFYTEAHSETEIELLAVHKSRQTGGGEVAHGDLLVTTQMTDYRRVKRFTHENLGVFPLDYPPTTLETSGYWVTVTEAAQALLMASDQWRDAPNDYGPNWQEQRQKVRARDGYRCTRCGAPEPANRQHDVHHVTPFRTFGYVPGVNENYLQANRLENLVLLCRRCHRLAEGGVRTRTGMDGLAYALGNLAPLHLMCDRTDLGVSVARQPEAPAPRIYIFERVAAGLGFSAELFERHETLLAGVEELIRACGCLHGCPACVGPVLQGPEDGPPLLETKQLTLALLQVLRAGAGPRASAPAAELSFRP